MNVLLNLPVLVGSTLVGYGLSKHHLLPARLKKITATLTSNLLLPCLLFSGTYQQGLPQQASITLLLAYYLPVCLLYGLIL
ncbi:hypothetical protein P2G88_05295 [Aliiglaciecola sp. CAU 1673]|uniref:hypothetical protein n=1 Tax=Aliiglaciecola sp. CAU 1673 TaxID=3032595 RepID=UPI0023D9F5FB|nr:hypothetical protein [Aliiglaciecola sp. CAU 1673]MDF2177660.1 hypothetical protein [Aliiglaciecola sp. CAU 1673]